MISHLFLNSNTWFKEKAKPSIAQLVEHQTVIVI